jgi:hypothetical protein
MNIADLALNAAVLVLLAGALFSMRPRKKRLALHGRRG